MRTVFLSAIAIGGGLFAAAVALFDWDRFMMAANAKPMVDLLGRKGARVFYACLGLLLITLGTLFAMGMLKLPAARSPINGRLAVRVHTDWPAVETTAATGLLTIRTGRNAT